MYVKIKGKDEVIYQLIREGERKKKGQRHMLTLEKMINDFQIHFWDIN